MSTANTAVKSRVLSYGHNPLIRRRRTTRLTPAEKRMAAIARKVLSRRMRTTGTLKWYDVAGGTGVTTSGVINKLFAVGDPSGSTGGRLSVKPYIIKISLRIQMLAGYSSIATADIYNTMRCVLLQSIGPASSWNATYLPSIITAVNDRTQYRLIRDWTAHLQNLASGEASSGSSGGVSPQAAWIIEDVPWGKYVTFADDSSTTDTDGMPVLGFVSDSTITPNPTSNWTARVWFKDSV